MVDPMKQLKSDLTHSAYRIAKVREHLRALESLLYRIAETEKLNLKQKGETKISWGERLSLEITKGFSEDIALRKRYQREGFGLDSVFEKRQWAEDQAAELKQTYGLTDTDIRLVQHISETGRTVTWEVYVKAGKGLTVLFLNSVG